MTRELATVDPYWIRGPADELAIAEGCWFDEERGRAVCEWIETFCCQSQGKWAGKPLDLIDWQIDFIMRLFGWKRSNGLRRYLRAYLEVAKKNGKSTMLSAIVLVLLLYDGEGAPKIYLNACDKEQAGIIFGESAVMVRASPEFSSRLKILDSPANKRIVDPEGNGVIIANSKVAASKDGLNPHGIIFDELHRQPDRQLVAVFEHASAAREQPLWIDITTAGEDDTGVWYEQREYSEKVNRGEIPDTTHLGVVYRADPADDIDDPATWRKANPSLGVTIKEEDFRLKLSQAKETPVKLADFKRLRLNVIARGAGRFVDPAMWAKCGGPPIDPAKMRGFACYAGGDLSSKIDLTALVLIWGNTIDGFDVWCRCYLPKDTIGEASKRDRVPYELWAEQGYLTLMDGPVVDYQFLRRDLNAIAADNRLSSFFCDPHNANQLLQQLQEEDGLPVQEIRQGFISLNEPTKELDRLIRAGLIRHGNNPLLTWMICNAVVVQDAAGCWKLDKEKSRLKIDAAAALVNAIAAATSGGPDGGESVYNERGVLLL